MRELNEIERFVLNPIFAIAGLLVVWMGYLMMKRSRRISHLLGFPPLVFSLNGCGLIMAGGFLVFVAITMTILGHTLLPG